EDPLVQLLSPLQPDRGVDVLVPADVEVAHELVEEQPPEALRAPRVPGEQSALHDLRQVDEGEDRPVGAGDVTPQDVLFLGSERLRHVDRHGGACYGRTSLPLGMRSEQGLARQIGRTVPAVAALNSSWAPARSAASHHRSTTVIAIALALS